MRRESGLTIIELIVVMAIFGLVMAGVVQMFTTTLTQFKQQGRIAESNIEGIIGLEMLRQDIENAGFGLPWRISSAVSYQEASAVGPSAYNDAKLTPPMNPPRAIVSGNNAGFAGSDELVIKATNVARNAACQKWTYVDKDNNKKPWEADADDLENLNRVIVLSPGTDDANRRALVDTGGIWKPLNYGATADFTPHSGYNFIYGIDDNYGIDDKDLRMPFNRADYYILDRSGSDTVPERCAPNAGILFKANISHSSGARAVPMPLLDCVANMQVWFRLDKDGDGQVDPGGTDVLNDIDTGFPLTAEQIRNQVKEVRVYILAHEGQRDRSYTHPTNAGRICVGELAGGLCTSGGEFIDVLSNVNYRWKVYTLIVKPKNLR